MKLRNLRILYLFVPLLLLLASCSPEGVRLDGGSKVVIPPEQIKSKHEITTSKGTFTFVKYVNDEGDVQSIIFDSSGEPVDEKDVGDSEVVSPYGKELQKRLKSTPSELKSEGVELKVFLEDWVKEPDYPKSIGNSGKGDGEGLVINGTPGTPDKLREINEERQRLELEYFQRRRDKRAKLLSTLIDRNKDVTITPEAKNKYLRNALGPLQVVLPLEKVEAFYEKNKDIIWKIEIKVEMIKESLASAMIETNVTSTVISESSHQGAGIGIYMTENCPCGMTEIPKLASGVRQSPYIYLDVCSSNDDHAQNVASIMRLVAPRAAIYCRSGGIVPDDEDLNLSPRITVMNASFGFNYDDTGYTADDSEWDDFIYHKSILLVKSAGNNGVKDGYVTTPGKGLNVLSVGNYNDLTHKIGYTSSWKDPEGTRNTKPEVCAPGVNIDAGYHYDESGTRVKIKKTGTSMAAPHVTAIIADLAGVYPALVGRPHLQKAFVIGGAYNKVDGGFDKVGWGGVDIRESLYGGHYWWWEGSNSDFGWFDRNDRLPNNGRIDVFYRLVSNKTTRIVLSWLNRGEWTLRNLGARHPIGMDLDFNVYDPDGNYIGGAYSWNDGFEVFEFIPKKTGEYRISIKRFANRDESSGLRMGLDIGTRDYN